MNNNDKKSVLLFNSPISGQKMDSFEMQATFPRVGIASIAACLLENNIKVRIVDPAIWPLEKIKELIKDFKPDFVGIPSFTSEIYDANDTAKFVKDISPKILAIVGGAHPSALPERTLKEFKNLDLAVVAEGEKTVVEIAQGKNLSEIKGIAYREKDGAIHLTEKRELIEDLNSLPIPAWHLYDLEKYRTGGIISGFGKKKKLLDLPVEGARGCPFRCKFCFRINGQAIRFKSPDRIADEVEKGVNRFRADSIFFVEGTFGVHREFTHQMCDDLIRRGLHKKIIWSTGGRVNVLGKPLLEKMKKSGCVFLGYGVESGDQELLNKMGKGITIQQIYESFAICKKLGIKTEANFILGHISETEETIENTIKFARTLKADFANFAIMVPFPGTNIFEMAVKGENNYRIRTYDWRLYGKQIGAAMEFKHISHEKMLKLQNKAYLYFFLTPSRFWRLIGRLTPGRATGALQRLFPILKKSPQ